MPDFQFTARDADGRQITDRRNALSAEDLAAQLMKESLTPIDISKATKQVARGKPANQTKWFQKKVSKEELQMLCRQMYTVLKAGIPIGIAVTRLAETSRNKTLSDALRQVILALNQGKSLYSSLAQFPNIFSDFFVNLVKVGENSGKLEAVFLHLADYLELESDTKKKLKTALRYPIMVIAANVIAIVVINLLVIPAFSQLFKSFGQQLPLPTKILMTTSDLMVNYWWILLIIVVLLIVGIRYYLKTPGGAMSWAKWQLKIPVIGWIIYRINLGRFTSLYSLVLQAGLPAVEGLDLVAGSTGNIFIAQKIKSVSFYVARGTTIANAVAQAKMFPPLIVQMITLGEETGNLDKMLQEVADFYKREVDYDLVRLSDAIEPILLIIMGAMVLILALGVFMPMWKIASTAGRG